MIAEANENLQKKDKLQPFHFVIVSMIVFFFSSFKKKNEGFIIKMKNINSRIRFGAHTILFIYSYFYVISFIYKSD